MERVISKLPQEKVAEARARINDTIKKGGNKPEAPKEKTALAKGLAIVTGKAVPADFRGNNTPPVADATVVSKSPVPPPPTAVPITSNTNTKVGATTSALPTATKVGGSSIVSPKKANPFDANSGANPFEDSAIAAPPAPNSPPPPPTATATTSGGRPGGAVPPPPPPPPAAAPPAGPPNAFVVEALYDIEAEADDELSFKAGDMIEVLETSDDGWWKGRVHGKEGLFPVNYVKT